MIRSNAIRAFPKPLSNYSQAAVRPAVKCQAFKAHLTSYTKLRASPTGLTKALAIRKPFATSLVRHESTVRNMGLQDLNEEKALQQLKLGARTDIVSTGSSVRHVSGEVGVEEHEEDVDMTKTIRQDVVSLRLQYNCNAPGC